MPPKTTGAVRFAPHDRSSMISAPRAYEPSPYLREKPQAEGSESAQQASVDEQWEQAWARQVSGAHRAFVQRTVCAVGDGLRDGL